MDIHGVVAPTEAHVSLPAIAGGVRLLKPSLLVEAAVVVVQTTSSHGVARGDIHSFRATARESPAPDAAGKATIDFARLTVASELTRSEAGITTEPITLRHHLFEGRLGIPAAVVVVHATTSGGVAAVRANVDDTSIVRLGAACRTCKAIPGVGLSLLSCSSLSLLLVGLVGLLFRGFVVALNLRFGFTLLFL